ncbi:MAG: rod shape-determining protein MreC [Minisyncoccia bacterium]
MSIQKLILLFILIFLLIIVIIYQYKIFKFLFGFKIFIANLKTIFSTNYDINSLLIENNFLKTKLLFEKSFTSSTDVFINNRHYLIANVYAIDPLLNTGNIIIDKGKNYNLQKGMVVSIYPGVLLGKIINVDDYNSEVQTIFSPEWHSIVGIGTSTIHGLLDGGLKLSINKVPLNSNVNDQDIVYNIDSIAPYGFILGSLEKEDTLPTSPWINLKLNVDYNIDDINKVYVLLND